MSQNRDNAQPYELLSRRQLLDRGFQVAGAGLIIAVVPKVASSQSKSSDLQTESAFRPSAYIEISEQGLVRIHMHRSEMGQNIHTTCAMLIAEELLVAYHQIQLIPSRADERLGDQNTDGSRSVRYNWLPLRLAGAAAREVLILAAAQRWKVSPTQLFAADGAVWRKDSQQQLTYQQLSVAASRLELPPKPTLLGKPGSFKKIGISQPNLQVHDIVTGKAIFGGDMPQNSLLVATIVRSPAPGGRLKDYDASPLLKIPGVESTLVLKSHGSDINTNNALAIIAKNTHAALSAKTLAADSIKWQLDNNKESTASLLPILRKKIRKAATSQFKKGQYHHAARKAHKTLKATFETPYLYHGCLEPLIATAYYDANQKHLTIWAPTQDPMRALTAASRVTGLDSSQVTLHVTRLGGGFGRKAQPDFVAEAAQIAMKTPSPVKVMWTREDDVKHGTYHAQCLQYLEGTIDKDQNLTGWLHRSGFASVAGLFTNVSFVGPTKSELNMGLLTMPYDIAHQRLESLNVPSALRIGWYRAVCHNFHCFAVECFIDEIAEATKKDPIELRLALLATQVSDKLYTSLDFDARRLIKVMTVVRQMSHWDDKSKSSSTEDFWGVACHYSFQSYVAMVIGIRKNANGQWRAFQVYAAVDCGIAVNPDTIKAQVEGAVIFGLSHTYYGRISVSDGIVQQANFDDYPLLRISETPHIAVEIIPSSDFPTGIGEPGVPPVAPAFVNALYRATHQRQRSLPLHPAAVF